MWKKLKLESKKNKNKNIINELINDVFIDEKGEPNDEIEYKLILLGDTSVGKTCLFKKITTGVFFDKNVSTIGIY